MPREDVQIKQSSSESSQRLPEKTNFADRDPNHPDVVANGEMNTNIWDVQRVKWPE